MSVLQLNTNGMILNFLFNTFENYGLLLEGYDKLQVSQNALTVLRTEIHSIGSP